MFICSFTRDNRVDNEKYYHLFNGAKPYVLLAYGNNKIGYHGINKEVTLNTITFQYSNANMLKNEFSFYFLFIIIINYMFTLINIL